MTSPFPGVDPYIEAQGQWPDFHARFLNYVCEALDDRLPANYVAKMEEMVHLVRPERSSSFRADIAVLHKPRLVPELVSGQSVATLSPVMVPLERYDLEEVREVWIEIRRLPDLSLVTVVELLSPSNKIGDGRAEYLNKRRDLIDQPVHLVELDLLLSGRRLPMQRPLPAGDAFAIVSRAERRPDAEVYAWPLTDSLPTIPIPLADPDPDIPLDLAPAYGTAYRRGRYSLLLRYQEPHSFPITAENRAWVEEIVGSDRA